MSNHVTTRTQEEIAALFTQDLVTGVGRSVKHDSADKLRVACEIVSIAITALGCTIEDVQ